MAIIKHFIITFFIVLVACSPVKANEWIPVTGVESLKSFMTGIEVERELPSGNVNRGIYRADGTGTLFSFGAEIPRRWEITGDDQVCVTANRDVICYRFERNSDNPNLYRATTMGTGEIGTFEVVGGQALVKESAGPGPKGGAAAPSADELAAELSNPNTAVATLNFKNQFRWFDGDLPNADSQSSYTMLFQPVLPFVLESGDKIIWRPAIPLIVDQPVFEPWIGLFDGVSGMGDIAFDLAYAPKLDGGLLTAFGLITSLPLATDEALGTDRWTLGPEFLIGKATPKWVAGLFPNHQWDVGGSGDANINLTTITAFYTYLPGGGWSVGTGPIMTFDWESEQWTVPLQLNVGKTVVWNGRPWKLSVEANYYVEKSDTFGPEWMIGINIAPVVKNGLASLFGL